MNTKILSGTLAGFIVGLGIGICTPMLAVNPPNLPKTSETQIQTKISTQSIDFSEVIAQIKDLQKTVSTKADKLIEQNGKILEQNTKMNDNLVTMTKSINTLNERGSFPTPNQK